MFRMLIHPSSGVCDYLVCYCVGCIVLTWGVLVLCSGNGCWWCGIWVQAEPLRYITPTRLKSAQYSLHNNTPSSRKLLKMDVLTSETCWAVNWHSKASVIKLVYLYSHIKMMHSTSSRSLLKMDVLTSETCWAVNWHNKASDIKLVYLYSNIKVMHGPIRVRYFIIILIVSMNYIFVHLLVNKLF